MLDFTALFMGVGTWWGTGIDDVVVFALVLKKTESVKEKLVAILGFYSAYAVVISISIWGGGILSDQHIVAKSIFALIPALIGIGTMDNPYIKKILKMIIDFVKEFFAKLRTNEVENPYVKIFLLAFFGYLVNSTDDMGASVSVIGAENSPTWFAIGNWLGSISMIILAFITDKADKLDKHLGKILIFISLILLINLHSELIINWLSQLVQT